MKDNFMRLELAVHMGLPRDTQNLQTLSNLEYQR